MAFNVSILKALEVLFLRWSTINCCTKTLCLPNSLCCQDLYSCRYVIFMCWKWERNIMVILSNSDAIICSLVSWIAQHYTAGGNEYMCISVIYLYVKMFVRSLFVYQVYMSKTLVHVCQNSLATAMSNTFLNTH